MSSSSNQLEVEKPDHEQSLSIPASPSLPTKLGRSSGSSSPNLAHRLSRKASCELTEFTTDWCPVPETDILVCFWQWVARKCWAAAPSTQSSTIESSVVHVADYRLLPPLTVVRGWPPGLRRWCCHAKSKRKIRVTSRPYKVTCRSLRTSFLPEK